MLGTPAGRPVVVGVDGSPASYAALSWAAEEARGERRPLRIVHAWDIAAAGVGYVPPDVEGAREAAGEVLDRLAEHAREVAGDLDVRVVPAQGPTARILVDESAHAAVLVVGSHARGPLTGLLLGSTSVEATAHAHCPVVVVPDPTHGHRHGHGHGHGHGAGHDPEPAVDIPWAGHVVAGLDGSERSSAALEFAFEAASRRGGGLTVLYAWNMPSPYLPEALVVLADEEQTTRQARLTVAESLAGWRERFPDVAVAEVVVHGHPVDALLRAAEDAALVVVGTHGRGGFRGMLLGSVSQALLRHSPCPVAVVRAPAR